MDRLSSLPCVLREKILCFLPTKNAVATSVLSRIWKVSYLSCDSLILNDSDSINSRVSNTNLRNFYSHIKCRKSDLVISKFSFVSSRVSKPQLITTVISELKHNYSDISDLDLITRLSHRFNLRLLDLPCQKLRVLKIDSCQCIDKHVLFPCLEIFYCSEVSFLDGCVTEILDGCPVLKDLKLIGCSWFNRDVVFRHDSLEKLEFDAGLKNDCSAVELSAISFDLPNLIWFKYNHGIPKRVSADFDSIVTAHVNICADYHESDFDGNPNPMLELVNGLSGAKYLHFTGSCLKVFTNNLLPKFQNLAQLKLGHCDSVSWSKMIPELVLTSPCLQIVALIQPINMSLAGVGGFKISGNLGDGVTAADVVVSVTHMLKKSGWRFFGKFVKFYGEGMSQVSIVERATLAILSSEYAGATMAFFPTDHVTLEYLKLTGRTNNTVSMIEQYLRADNMFVDYIEPQQERVYSSILELDLAKVEPCMSPKRSSEEMKADWDGCLKGFAIPKEHQSKVIKSLFHCQPAELEHGRVVIAAITSSSKTSNCSVMLGAALVTKKACQLGLERYTGHETIIIAGAEYGSGSSPDWDAKGPVLQGVKAVIAKSFQGIHLSNLVGKGVIFLCFKPGKDAHTLGLTEQEQYTIGLPSHVSELRAGQDVTVTTDAGKSFTCTVNLGTELA